MLIRVHFQRATLTKQPIVRRLEIESERKSNLSWAFGSTPDSWVFMHKVFNSPNFSTFSDELLCHVS